MRRIREAMASRGISISMPAVGSGGGSWTVLELGTCSITLGVVKTSNTDAIVEMHTLSWHNESLSSRLFSWREHRTEACSVHWRNLLDAFEDAVKKDLGAICFQWVPSDYASAPENPASGV